jgi:hypothetical protein
MRKLGHAEGWFGTAEQTSSGKTGFFSLGPIDAKILVNSFVGGTKTEYDGTMYQACVCVQCACVGVGVGLCRAGSVMLHTLHLIYPGERERAGWR